VFVGGVLMIKLMLDETGELAEFGNVFAEQIDIVHRAEDWRNVSALVENGQKALTDVLIGKKRAIHERELIANELKEVRMQSQAALLGIEKHAHEAAGLIAEDAIGRGVDFAVDEFETVEWLRRGFLAARKPGAE
jgi:hypothetical protein